MKAKNKELINDLRLELFVQQEINKELLQKISNLEEVLWCKQPNVPQKVDTGPIFLDQVEAAL